MLKRIFDMGISVLLFILLLPVFTLISILIKFFMGSPVLFVQERPGRHTKPFRLYKFRTMNIVADGKDIPEAARITVLGEFLRKYSMDEIPQFINVLKGDMSLVGPRPLLMEYIPLYSNEQMKRHLVKPGMTGWAQINGRNQVTWEERFRNDIWYVHHQNLVLDCKILWWTFIKVVKKEGINQYKTEPMEKFNGTYEETQP